MVFWDVPFVSTFDAEQNSGLELSKGKLLAADGWFLHGHYPVPRWANGPWGMPCSMARCVKKMFRAFHRFTYYIYTHASS